jgi:hypothetical protein
LFSNTDVRIFYGLESPPPKPQLVSLKDLLGFGQQNMKNLINILLSFLILIVIFSTAAATADAATMARASASLKLEEEKEIDNRAVILEKFLEQYNSPFADKADVFVREADKNNLDWKFVAAISGIESTFGQRYPQGTYNAWGWGIYGDNMHYFASWDEAISTISYELRTRYMDQWGATNTYEIGRYYAANPTWASKVEYFMRQMEEFEREYDAEQLPILI